MDVLPVALVMRILFTKKSRVSSSQFDGNNASRDGRADHNTEMTLAGDRRGIRRLINTATLRRPTKTTRKAHSASGPKPPKWVDFNVLTECGTGGHETCANNCTYNSIAARPGALPHYGMCRPRRLLVALIMHWLSRNQNVDPYELWMRHKTYGAPADNQQPIQLAERFWREQLGQGSRQWLKQAHLLEILQIWADSCDVFAELLQQTQFKPIKLKPIFIDRSPSSNFERWLEDLNDFPADVATKLKADNANQHYHNKKVVCVGDNTAGELARSCNADDIGPKVEHVIFSYLADEKNRMKQIAQPIFSVARTDVQPTLVIAKSKAKQWLQNKKQCWQFAKAINNGVDEPPNHSFQTDFGHHHNDHAAALSPNFVRCTSSTRARSSDISERSLPTIDPILPTKTWNGTHNYKWNHLDFTRDDYHRFYDSSVDINNHSSVDINKHSTLDFNSTAMVTTNDSTLDVSDLTNYPGDCTSRITTRATLTWILTTPPTVIAQPQTTSTGARTSSMKEETTSTGARTGEALCGT
uniref:DDE_Tnp_1_7 domain-containing protein n=1 Tax=Globodera pallida TaxID=36090 RepID=A0A183BP63_GLOPA